MVNLSRNIPISLGIFHHETLGIHTWHTIICYNNIEVLKKQGLCCFVLDCMSQHAIVSTYIL